MGRLHGRRSALRRFAALGLGSATLGGLVPSRPAGAADLSGQALRTAASVVAHQKEVLADFQKVAGVGHVSATPVPLDEAEARIASGAFDCYELNAQGLPALAGHLEPIAPDALRHWSDVRPLFERPDPRWPATAQAAGQIRAEDGRLLAVPTIFGFDAPGYRADRVEAEAADTWTALFEPRFKGRVALLDDPLIAIGEVVLALDAKGELEAANPGDPSVQEIDRAVDWLIELKKAGQFHSLWRDPHALAKLFVEGSVVLADVWEPTIFEARRQGAPCDSAVPREGYRGWVFGVAEIKGTPNAEAVRAYADYWLSGPPGALVSREGYFSPADTVRDVLSPELYGYLYQGHPYLGPSLPGIAEGALRRGGSLDRRTRRCRFWTQWPKAHRHLLARWEEFRKA